MPSIREIILAGFAIGTINLTGDHSLPAFAQVPTPTTIVIERGPPPTNYYEGSTQVETFDRNTMRTTRFCGWESNNPQRRQYAEIKVQSNGLRAGETVVFEIDNEDTDEVIRKEIHGGGPPGSNFTTHDLALGTWIFFIHDGGQIIPAGIKDIICPHGD